MITITNSQLVEYVYRHVALTHETTCAICRGPILSAAEVAAGASFHLFCAGCVRMLAEVLAGPVDGEREPARRVEPGVLADRATPQDRALKECARFLKDCSGPEADLLARLVRRIEHGRGMVAADPDALDRERQDALINLLVVAAMVAGSEGV